MRDVPYAFILIKNKNYPIPETAIVNITLTLFLLSQMWNEQIPYFHPGQKLRNVYLSSPLKQDVTQVRFFMCGTRTHSYKPRSKTSQSPRPLSHWCRYYTGLFLLVQIGKSCSRVGISGTTSHITNKERTETTLSSDRKAEKR